MIIGVLAIAGAVGVVALADDSSASTFDLVPDEDDYAKVSGSLSYKLKYIVDADVPYTAKIVDSKGDSVGSVSPSSGTLYKGGSDRTLSLSMPSTAGDYKLVVEFTENDAKVQRTAFVRAVDPIELSITVENKGDASRTFMVHFYIKDGDSWNKIEDSGEEITVDAKGTKDVTYDYIVRDVRNTTFCLVAETGSLGEEISGLGFENAHSFYTSPNDYTLIEWICVIVLLILIVIAIWIYRKPIRNRGKPKGRR